MTISLETRRAGIYQGDGAQTIYPFGFKVFESNDVIVLGRPAEGDEAVLEPSLYRVDINANQDTSPGGNITFYTPPAKGTSLVILSNVDYLQTMVLTNHGGFYPKSVESAFDKTTAQIQQLKEKLDRAIEVPATDPRTPQEFTSELLRAQVEAREFAAEAQASADKAEGYAQDASIVVGMQDVVKTVADHIEPVKTTAANITAIDTTSDSINAIRTVASDFTKTVELPGAHDFGRWGTDNTPGTVPVGGAIRTVSDNIAPVRTVANAVTGLSAHYTAIETVARHTTSIDTVSGHVTEIDTVANNMTIVADAAGVVSDLNESIARVEQAAATVDANQQGALDAATRAEASAQSASTSATEALGARDNARSAESMAKAWATSSTKPDGAMESAKTYAERAYNQAQTATTQASNALTASQASAQSATSASSSASQALTSANNAKQSEQTASTKAASAGASATSAANSATASAQSATSAQTYASQASASAGSAKTSETNASTSASEAAASASDAETSATNAGNSATAAQGAREGAVSAQQSAEQAKADAEGLVGAAQTAVRYVSQTLTADQQSQARANMGLGTMATQNLDLGKWSAS